MIFWLTGWSETIIPKVKEVKDSDVFRRGKVLVHCNDGMSRSRQGSLVIAYIMQTYGIDSRPRSTMSSRGGLCPA